MRSIQTSWPLIIAVVLGFPFVESKAKEQRVQLQLESGHLPRATQNVALLKEINVSFQEEKWATCANQSLSALGKFKEIKPWIYVLSLQCHFRFLSGDPKSKEYKSVYSGALRLLNEIWNEKDNLVYTGPSAEYIRDPLQDLTFFVIENQLKAKAKSSWRWIDELLAVKVILNEASQAKVYKLSAELALADQNWILAQESYERSLNIKWDKNIQLKLEALSAKTNIPLVQRESLPVKESLSAIISEEEGQLLARMESAIKSKDYLAGLDDGLLIIKKFSGGINAEKASRSIINIYLGIASHSEEKYLDLKDKIIQKMRSVDGQRLYDWAQILFQRELYSDLVLLLESRLKDFAGQSYAAKSLLLCGLAAQQYGDYAKASNFFQILIREHAGARLSAEALYRLGILHFREKQYAEAKARFEQFLGTEHSEDFDLSALYWAWRAEQKINPEKSLIAAEKLIAKYPLSYYGLRARAELAGGQLKLDHQADLKLAWSLSLAPHEYGSWQRYLILVKAGWMNSARAELAALPPPITKEGKVIFSELWANSREFQKSAMLLYEAMQMDSRYISTRLLRFIFPTDYLDLITKEAKRYKIPPELVLSLVKQESSFDNLARSTAGAIGLMQLMTATARELSADMNLKSKDVAADLQKPNFNIRLGTQYLHRRLKFFDGHVPLALAAYNAGIGNIKSWLKTKSEKDNIRKVNITSYEEELWFDELPWPETSGYIKSILRNLLIYKLLDKGEIPVADPVWEISKT